GKYGWLFQPSLRDWGLYTARFPALKRWAILGRPYGTKVSPNCRMNHRGLSGTFWPPLRGVGSTLLRFPGRCPGLPSGAPPGRTTGKGLSDKPVSFRASSGGKDGGVDDRSDRAPVPPRRVRRYGGGAGGGAAARVRGDAE